MAEREQSGRTQAECAEATGCTGGAAGRSGGMMAYHLGIDLGTTFSAAAVSRSVGAGWTAPEMVGLSDRRTDVASVVFVGPDGGFVVGAAAERRALSDPDRVVREFKRRLGDPTPVVVGGRTFTPEELCARLVRWIVDAVATQEGGPAERIALTHPASWGDHKLALLAEALDAHGLTVTFLAEPQAAALHYAANERVLPGSAIAVYDLGGGTFDAAVVRKGEHGGFGLQGRPEGLDRLGGVDFDQVVFDHVVAGLPEAFDGLDETDPAVLSAVARLRRDCTEAKEALSADTEADVPVLLPGLRATVRLHRGEFSEAIREQVGETVEALRRAVASAGLRPESLDAVLLVGGSSRVPLVSQMLSEELGRPVTVDTDPTHAIAKGAVLAVCPVAVAPDAPVTPVSPVVGMPALVGMTVGTAAIGRTPPEIGAPVHSTGTWANEPPAAEPGPFDGWAAGATPPPRPAVGAEWEYDPEPPARRRAPLMVGVGGVVAVLAVAGAVLLWPTAEPAVTSGVGGIGATAATSAPVEAPQPESQPATQPAAPAAVEPDPVTAARPAATGSRTGLIRPSTVAPVKPVAPVAPAAPGAPPAAPPPAAPPAAPPSAPAGGTPPAGTGTDQGGSSGGTTPGGTGSPAGGTGTPAGGGAAPPPAGGTPPAGGGTPAADGSPSAPPPPPVS